MKRTVTIDHLYLDNTRCTRCRGTDDSLARSEALLQPVLQEMGVEVRVRRTHVRTAEDAERLGMRTSPTLLVDGRDLQPGFAESSCGSCSDLAPSAGGVECREWTWQGRSWTEAPVGLIVEGVLRAVLTPQAAADTPGPLPENLRRFFAGAACCSGEPRGCC